MSDTISIPRELLERVTNPASEAAGRRARIELCDLLDKPSDGALTNEGAEPVAWRTGMVLWGYKPDAILNSERHGMPVEPLYRHPPKVCTCPSGDGSLRWPCPVHPPEVKALVLPERRSAIDTFNTYGLGECNGWNACLDRVKELNS